MLAVLKDVEDQAQMSNEEASFLRTIFNSNKLQALLRVCAYPVEWLRFNFMI